tara:strand:- start:247 stop:819 length:573 start_codon:yes stop_codon:yes gene_type:complete
MKFNKYLITKIFFILINSQFLFNISQAKSADEIKIVYSIFSRTIRVNSLKNFAKEGNSTNKLKRILKATGSPDQEIRSVLNKDFEIPITIASKLVYSEIGNVFLTRLSSIIHPPRADDERTGMLALRASVIQGINIGNGKINLVNFFEGYPTKTVILDVNALSKIMKKVESISELLEFFTNSPLEKIKTN